MDRAERFWTKVEFTDTCWLWRGAATGRGGPYGSFSVKGRSTLSHRWAYEFCVGKIPDGLLTDHLCRVRLCVRPDHIELVSNRTNILRGIGLTAVHARKTHCIHGHEFTPENTYRSARGWRYCRACNKASVASARAKKAVPA